MFGDDIELDVDFVPHVAADAMIVFDRSLRSKDADGHLHVETANITKANVCPYMGSEIPNAQELGLEPSKVYWLYRDAAELQAAAKTYENKPLMMQHVAVSADDPQKYYIVGTVSNVRWSPPYLKASLAVWDAEAIRLIENEEQKELSCGYRYVADMSPGSIDGTKYDGIMRNLACNHVALVKTGRAGHDVFVSDSLPQEIDTMKLSLILAAMKPFLATDAKVADIDAAVKAAIAQDKAKDESVTKEAEKKAAEDKAKDEADKAAKDEADKKAAEDCSGEDEDMDADDEDVDADDEAPEAPVGGAPKPGKDKKGKDKAMDAAVASAVTAALAARDELHAAREFVKPILGVVQFDSAEAIYGEALKKIGVDTKGVPAPAYGALLRATVTAKGAAAPVAGLDSASAAKPLHEAFTGYNRLSR